jgi:hypothetical protein
MKHNAYCHACQNKPADSRGISPKAKRKNGIIGKVGGGNYSYRESEHDTPK